MRGIYEFHQLFGIFRFTKTIRDNHSYKCVNVRLEVTNSTERIEILPWILQCNYSFRLSFTRVRAPLENILRRYRSTRFGHLADTAINAQQNRLNSPPGIGISSDGR